MNKIASITLFLTLFIIVSMSSAFEPLFDARVDYDTEGLTRSVVSYDFDEDGDHDLLVTTSNDGKVLVFLNNGDGTFQEPIKFDAGLGPGSMYASDLDGDGDIDLAVTNAGYDNISILLNNGDLTFQSPVSYSAGDGPYSLFASDLDGDSDNDLAAVNLGSENVSVLLNNGDGTFQEAVSFGSLYAPMSISAADLDGDGYNDLIVASFGSYSIPGFFSVFFNNGDGTFQEAVDYITNQENRSVFAADFDGDLDNDLAVSMSNQTSIYFNNGDGTFQEPVNYISGLHGSTYAADMNNDNHKDLMTVEGTGARVMFNNGDGTFGTTVFLRCGKAGGCIYPADLDDDGYNDIAVSNVISENVSVIMNNGDGTFNQFHYSVGDKPLSIYAADLDGDTDNDLAVANNGSNDISVLLNNGDGTFQTAVNYSAGSNLRAIAAADLDGDNDNDIAAADRSTEDNVLLLFNNGDGTFQAPVYYETFDNPMAICVSDFNGDNDNDIAVVSDVNWFHVFVNDGNGIFYWAGGGGETGGYSPRSIIGIDLDGDSDNDLAVANLGSHNVSVFLNQGNGQFDDAVNYDTGISPQSIFGADLDGDGDTDLATSSQVWQDISVLFNNGDGTFQAPVTFLDPGPGSGYSSVFAADLNGDGNNDLITGNQYETDIAVLLSNGDGTFLEPGRNRYGTGSLPKTLFAADFNGDGNIDIAAANYDSDNVHILLNTGADGIEQGSIAGTVTDTMLPIEGVYVSAIGTEVSDYTDTSGEYTLPDLSLGQHNVIFQHVAYIDTTVENVIVNNNLTSALDVVMIPGEEGGISGYVTDDSGEPIEDVLVEAEVSSAIGAGKNRLRRSSESLITEVVEYTYTDSAGYYELWLLIGTYNLHLSHEYLIDTVITGIVVETEQTTEMPPIEMISSGYPYLPGDANMFNGLWPPQVIGADVTFLVNYFRGTSEACLLNGFYCSADANGDCLVIGSDVTRMVTYFRGLAEITPCPDYPPTWPTPDDLPVDAPDGWPNCETPPVSSKIINGSSVK